jgi:outer membrane protein OmpA-like peptidoglycan-associated protein/tetratricopeptide (TPR) repeat protein
MRFLLFPLLVLITFLSGTPSGLAQSELKRADNLYDNFEYAMAIQAFQKVLEKKEPTLEITQKLAHSYRLINDSRNAEFWFSQVLMFPERAEINLLFYADAAKKNGKYDKAKELYALYASKVHNDAPLAKALAASCDLAIQWRANPEPIDVKKDSLLNSSNSDFGLSFFGDGVLFASDRPGPVRSEKGKDERSVAYGWTGRPYLQLYYASKVGDNGWTAPKALSPVINTQYHNAAAVYSANERLLYFTRTNMIKEKQKDANTDPTSWVERTSPRDFVNRLELFTVEKKGNEWVNLKPFPYNDVTKYSIGHPALSPDGQVLYFASDMPGGFGGVDIYYCLRQSDGSWGKPINAGKEINTSGRECFPTLDASGMLFFASDGHPGMGGLDLFSAKGAQGTWAEVRNLKYPLNSSKDDFGIVYDSTGVNGYFSSNRDSEDGIDNIYSFKPTAVSCILAGRTVERIMEKKKSQELGVDNVLVKLYRAGDTTAIAGHSDEKGNFSFKIYEGITYTIKASKPGYLTRSVTVTPDCKSLVNMERLKMDLIKNEIDRSYVIENIYYDLDKHEIRPDAKPELDKVVRMMLDNPRIRIELSSHTDSRQTDQYNQILSQLRAESAVRYIISRGVNINRITAKGYGESKLLNRCKDGVPCSEDEHQLNRRTEFRVLDTGLNKVAGK